MGAWPVNDHNAHNATTTTNNNSHNNTKDANSSSNADNNLNANINTGSLLKYCQYVLLVLWAPGL